jgi:hypothetical protein
VRLGDAPWWRHHGRARSQCGLAVVEGLETVKVLGISGRGFTLMNADQNGPQMNTD